jgi:putative DNA primase/helicase
MLMLAPSASSWEAAGAVSAALEWRKRGRTTGEVDGALDWQRDGLQLPDRVRKATADYRDEEFELGEFVAECCDVRDGAQARSADLYRAYTGWTERVGDSVMSNQKFGRLLSARFAKRHINRRAVYDGLEVAETDRG